MQTLRECVDDLRLVVDSLDVIESELTLPLGSLRERLSRRLNGADLRLDWQIVDLPAVDWLQPADALRITRIVQEAVANIIQHGAATQVRVVTQPLPGAVEIRIEDDGAGFDTARVSHGRGLRHIRRRAAQLGAFVYISSTVGAGTVLSLHIPLHRDREHRRTLVLTGTGQSRAKSTVGTVDG